MNTKSTELWCEHEFVVVVNRSSGKETHCVSMFGDGELIEDIVFDDQDARVVKEVSQEANERNEVEYNAQGHIMITRKTEPGEHGTVQVHEASHGALRSERTTIQTIAGETVVLREKLFTSNVLQSEAETHYTPEGIPSLTVTSSFAADGRLVKSEQVVWHSENRPALSECTEYDWYGAPEFQTNTLHHTDGTVIWQERTKAPESAAKPSKTESFAFEIKPKAINNGGSGAGDALVQPSRSVVGDALVPSRSAVLNSKTPTKIRASQREGASPSPTIAGSDRYALIAPFKSTQTKSKR